MNFEIEKNEKYIIIRPNIDGIPEVFTYNQLFLDILDRWHLSMFRDNGRLRATLYLCKEKGEAKYSMSSLAFACYKGLVTVDNFTADMAAFMVWKANNKLDIDHADSNTQNNTVNNLSLMDSSLNKLKHTYTRKFIYPYNLVSAVYGSGYKLVFDLHEVPAGNIDGMLEGTGYKTTRPYVDIRLSRYCPDAESYVSQIRELYNSEFDCLPHVTPRQHAGRNPNIYSTAHDLIASINAQEQIVRE